MSDVPEMTAPSLLFVWLSSVPIVFTPLPPVLVATQALPFQIKPIELPAVMVTPYIVNAALPLTLLTYTIRPEVVVVGFGKVNIMLAVVWVTSKAVATSTVVAALPIVLFEVWFTMATELNKVLPALVNC